MLDIALHEVAHLWLLEAPAAPLRTEDMFNEGVVALMAAAETDLLEDVLRCEAQNARQANALARRWGGLHGETLWPRTL